MNCGSIATETRSRPTNRRDCLSSWSGSSGFRSAAQWLTLSQEGSCGQLKLADFDRLDLSNLNRLRAGIHDLRLPKTVLAARQIYELNPYARISLFSSGLTPDNLDSFLTGSPSLDVLVDECDSLRMKFLMRERARQLQLPVLMETSDRGMLDVERFDIEPDRPIFHGLVNELTSADLEGIDREERAAVVLKIVGATRVSTRLGASMLEIDRTISTWPQLASDVALGGSSASVAVRRIALGQPLESGRTYVDLEAVISGLPARAGSDLPGSPDGSDTAEASPPTSAAGGDAEIPEFIRYVVEHATLAPSGGNCQPWQFYFDRGTLWVVHDTARSRNLLDGRGQASLLALGAAIENLVIAAAERGYATRVDDLPRPDHPAIVAALRFESSRGPEVAGSAGLFSLLRCRESNRRLATRRRLTPQVPETLRQAAAHYGAHLQLVTQAAPLDELGEILGEGDRLRFLCRDLHRELFAEVRWTPRDVQRTRDGIDVATLELTAAQDAAMRVLARPDVAAFLRSEDAGSGIAEMTVKAVAAAAAVGLLTLSADTTAAWLHGGRALQRVWLAAAALGVSLQPMTALLFMFDMLGSASVNAFTERERSRLVDMQVRLDRVFDERVGAPRAMLFRLAYAPEPTARSLRRPSSMVIHAGPPPKGTEPCLR
jgi:nitroreductase